MILNIMGDFHNVLDNMVKWLNNPSNERAFWLIMFFAGVLIFIIVYEILNKKK